MSSQALGYSASRVIDGNRSGNYASDSIAETEEEQGAWIEVDLGSEKFIDKVDLFNADESINIK